MPARMILAMLLAWLILISGCAPDVDSKLIEATGNGHTETVQELLGAAADVNAKDRDGWTALMQAAFFS